MKIEKIKISLISENIGQIPGLPANPRFIKDANFNKLVKSLCEDPEMTEMRPLLIYPFNDQFVIIGGNMRYRAARELGWSEINCIVIPAITPIEKLKAYTIKDNGGFGEWDYDMLAQDWEEDNLSDWGIDFFKNERNTDKIEKLSKKEIYEQINEETLNKIAFYKPTNSDKKIEECIDFDRFEEIKKIINISELSKAKKEIYILLAARCLKINFADIADIYCSQSDEEKEIFRQLGLVIPDVSWAIANEIYKINDTLFNVAQNNDDDENEEN
jgi:hypothetical protein